MVLSSIFLQPHPGFLSQSFPNRTGALTGLRPSQTHFSFSLGKPSPFLRGGGVVVRLGPSPGLPDFESAEGWARELFDRAEGILYTVADAVASSPSSSSPAEASAEGMKQSSDWLSGITGYLETVLKVLKDGLSALHVPYAYGFAIILLTVLVKGATFPLTKKQVESAIAMRSLQPQVKAIQERYAGDQERIQLETARLYKLAGVNPLAGCLPTLATIPVWIGLYRALSNVANEGLLTEGFFWIPSLAGPTTVAARQSGSGTSWLFPFVDGHPPLGWSDTFAYLVLPALLVVSQYISAQIMQPSQGNDPNQKSSQAITKLLPLMIGYFALSVPSGLSLYWFTNNLLSTAQQIWLQKLGGAKNPVREFRDETTKVAEINNQKPAPDVDSDKVKSRREEKSEPGGLRPGERFKLIKEQEARRRQEIEEERRAEEAAKAKESQINDEAHTSEDKLVESKVQVEDVLANGVDEGLQSDTAMRDTSNVTIVNGSDSKQDFEKQTNTHMSMTNNVRLACNGDPVAKDELSAHENMSKEEITETHTSAGSITSSEHDVLDRREQASE